MISQVYSSASRLLLITVFVAGCGGGGGISEGANSSSRFDSAMHKLLRGEALTLYEQDKAQSLTYAQEVCNHLDAGKTDRNFSGTAFESYLSYELNAAQQEYSAAIISAAVNEVCPRHRSKL